jgi:hypothetical protein
MGWGEPADCPTGVRHEGGVTLRWCLWGVWGDGEHFPAFQAGSESKGSAAGLQRRSFTYPQAFPVHLPRRAITEALMPALLTSAKKLILMIHKIEAWQQPAH